MSEPDHPRGVAPPVELGTEQGRRILELLWDPPTLPGGRGPKPKITLADVIEGGVAIADADGLASLSMRKVAGRLGVGAMSLYTYVPGRDELVELMVNRVHAELGLPAADLAWRASVEQQVADRWRMYERHPWLLDLNMARMPIGPHVLERRWSPYGPLPIAHMKAFPPLPTIGRLDARCSMTHAEAMPLSSSPPGIACWRKGRSPLFCRRPSEPFEIELAQAGGGRFRFRVLRGHTLIATGTIEAATACARPTAN